MTDLNALILRRALRLSHLLDWCSDWRGEHGGMIDQRADSMHWCDQTGEDFHFALAQACRHYVNELNGEQPDERRTGPQPEPPAGRPVPPDPEGRNDSRAAWAEYAVAAFVCQTGTDAGDAVTDLLCDLMLLADRNGTDFAADLGHARMHSAAETQPDFTTEDPTTSPTPTKGLDA